VSNKFGTNLKKKMIPVRARFKPQNYYSDCEQYAKRAVTVTNTLEKSLFRLFVKAIMIFLSTASSFVKMQTNVFDI
jgi:hypothetical protein